MNALREIGFGKIVKFIFSEFYYLLIRACVFSPVRVVLLRIAGAEIGANTIVNRVCFINLYRVGINGLSIGSNCFIADEVMIDLAERVVIGDHVTIAPRVVVLTHLNVGYQDHPLQRAFPSEAKPVYIARGSFIGANATVLCGVRVGERSFIGAGALVNKSIEPNSVAGGVPVRVLRKLDD